MSAPSLSFATASTVFPGSPASKSEPVVGKFVESRGVREGTRRES